MTEQLQNEEQQQEQRPQEQKEEQGEVVREVTLKVDTRFAMVRVEPKPDGEGSDANFPRNLHNAAELFLRVDMVDAAQTLQQCTSGMLDLYANNPDGSTGISIGRACICWNCGHVGLPKQHYDNDERQQHTCISNQDSNESKETPTTKKGNNKKSKKAAKIDNKKNEEYGTCRKCNETDQTNWVRVMRQTNTLGQNTTTTTQADGNDLPWIEKTPLTPEEQAKKDAAEREAKRKEIEANVAAALAERLAASTTVSSS